MGTRKAHPERAYLPFAILVLISTLLACFFLRPELLHPRIALSVLGAFPPTRYIFTPGLLLAAILLWFDGRNTKGHLQKISRYGAALGFVMLGLFPIEHGELLGNLHRFGGLTMLLSVDLSLVVHVIQNWYKLPKVQRTTDLIFALVATISVALSILSSSQVRVFALQGVAQYIGLISLVGWAIIDTRSIN